MIDMYDHRGMFSRDYVRSLEAKVFAPQSAAERVQQVNHGNNCDCETCAKRNANHNAPNSSAAAVWTGTNPERRYEL